MLARRHCRRSQREIKGYLGAPAIGGCYGFAARCPRLRSTMRRGIDAFGDQPAAQRGLVRRWRRSALCHGGYCIAAMATLFATTRCRGYGEVAPFDFSPARELGFPKVSAPFNVTLPVAELLSIRLTPYSPAAPARPPAAEVPEPVIVALEEEV